MTTEEITDAHIESYGLLQVDDQLQVSGKTLKDFHLRPPSIEINVADLEDRRLLAEELSYNRPLLRQRMNNQLPTLNDDQRFAFETITNAIYGTGTARLFMLDGPGGTGKTHLENLLLAFVRERADIALAVSSTGISAILLDGGRTAYSRFKIPFDITSNSTCPIPRQSHLAELLRRVCLIIWDEISSQHRYAVEAVERTMRDIRNSNEWFRGCVVVTSGNTIIANIMFSYSPVNRRLATNFTRCRRWLSLRNRECMSSNLCILARDVPTTSQDQHACPGPPFVPI